MKRIVSLLMILVVLFTLAGCSGGGEKMESLDGKKILFIGNSFTYYGRAVINKAQTILTQQERSDDKGFFYHLCKSNGAEVSVTNWCFGGHTLEHLFGGNCSADRGCDGVDHLSYLTDRVFDYVIIQEGSAIRDSLEWVEKVKEIFLEANPDTKFVFLETSNAHFKEFPRLSFLKDLEKKGFIIVDWGAIIKDIVNGVTDVPGGTEEYDKYSFIVGRSESDGYHPNMLTGYITTLMTYCAITGESAVGQDYSFCNDSSKNKRFDLQNFANKNYTYGAITTNFPEVFESEGDMKGIQKLIDKYLKEKPYLEY